MEPTNMKTLKEVFKDYNFTSFALSEAKIACLNVYKKTNTLEIKMNCHSPVFIKDLIDFETYLGKRFRFSNIDIKIQNEIEQKADEVITSQWSDIVEYMAYKHPLTKALLKNSSIQIESNHLTIKLMSKGKQMLEARNMHQIICQKLQDLYHQTFQVQFQEEMTEEMHLHYQEQTKELEKQAILLARQEAVEHMQEVREDAMKQKATTKQEKQISQTTEEIPFDLVPPEPVAEEKTPLILGRNMNIKEPLVKVVDLTVDSGKILLDGEILNTDERELKSGKFLLTFDLYDGSSTITCKAFVEAEKKPEVMRKTKSSKRN